MNYLRLNKSWQNLKSELWNVTQTSILKTPKLVDPGVKSECLARLPASFAPMSLQNEISLPRTVETFQKLQKAKEILTNEESRARYDHWRRSQMSMPFQQWEALNDSVKTSMHWVVRGKKDLMLEESDKTHTTKIENEEWNEQRERKKEELASIAEKTEQKEPKPLEKSVSPQNSDSSSFSDVNGWHLRFRWSKDAPSELLRKFRNYEI
ncbi:dnaJ homolog subfamily C member 12 isoform X2 [Pan paniscus]|uniref:dnaJ homolog subfamily C member 12 isoform X2 n=1 Tax=Pan paniscus TaxID=9597 RepID=UPI0004F076B5|nr:dnaJ homolog subfamily C member 12 isoform X2 [Pan paniscus]XP_009456825.1 dnaJ homolog subfamily C member 12 isoform X4 [Pan troglodytes]XP_016773874.1 dnaJ homolog subfamily C member 12 isoform X4 [Pan troglodytes]